MSVYYIGSVPCSGGDIYHYGRKGMKWGKNIFGKISEFFTGNNARGQLNAARANQRGYNTQNRLAAKYDYRDVDNNGSALNWNVDKRNMGKNPKGYGPTISANERVQNAQAAYDKTLPGMMAKARQQVSNAYSQAAEKLGGKGLDIQSFYSQVMQKAQDTINRGKSMVSKYGGQFVSQIETVGKNALAGGKSFLDGIMKKVKQVKSKATEPISRLKARDAEKRDRDSEIGKQDTHKMLTKRRSETQKYYKTDRKFMKETGWDRDIDQGAPGRTRLADERDGQGYYPNAKFTPQGSAKLLSTVRKNKKK